MNQIYKALFVLLLMSGLHAAAQQMWLQKTTTEANKGHTISGEMAEKPASIDMTAITGGSSKAPGINWQYTDPVSIGSSVKVSEQAQQTFVAWWLNNIRASLYGNSASAMWETPVAADFEFPVDMTPDGLFAAVGFGNLIKVFSTINQTLVWEKTTDGTVASLKLTADGTKIYVMENSPGGQDKANVRAYQIGQDDPIWTTSFVGTGVAFAASGDRSKLAFCQYPGAKKMFILEADGGEVIFNAFYRNQSPPALSYDGKFIISGDYGGYAYLHEYNESAGTYHEKWNFKVGGGGTSAWVIGVDVSADGSTVAVGTLVFLSSDFNGEIYLFNTYSNEPIWVYQNCGDEISSISVSADGSLIAAAGWGPLNNSKPDFYLFRKQSNVPLFTLSTAGSFNSVNLSPDGTYCSVTGKAVHARVMGSGGLLYNINTDPGGGKIAGNIQLQGAPSFENTKVMVEGLDNYYSYSDANGNFELKYIPAGTYTVTASKVGYFPSQQTGVVISEGGLVNLNFILSPTGNPPTDLNATQGEGYSVKLQWNHPDPSAVNGFNVYRKTIPEALFPETPIATTGNNLLEFEDISVKPLKTYYYAVTADLDQSAESPYSNVADGWMASGFVVNEISAYSGSAPVIDGTISPGEWDDAFEMDASDFFGTYDNNPNPMGSVTMYFKVNPEMTELYVACLDQNKPVLQDNFTVAMYIDDNNDGSYPPSGTDTEGNYWARYFASGNVITYRPIYDNGGVGQNLNLTDPQVAASDATGFVVMELVIPMGVDEVWKINPNEFNQSGLFMFTTNFDGYWPALNQQIFYPLTYGAITFGAEDDVPVPPSGTDIYWDGVNAPVMITLSWNQPPINDFDHFRIYINEGSGFELLSQTIGTQVFYTTNNTNYTLFRVTTVDKSGQESAPSEEMVFDITLGVGNLQPTSLVNVYPNPGRETINIWLPVDEEGFYTVSVYDLNGGLVQNLWEGNLQQGEYIFRWNGNNSSGIQQKPGIYLVVISGNQIRYVEKLLRM